MTSVHDSSHRSTAVIGAGISGLAAAYRLRKLVPDAPITVFEASGRPGGKILTEHQAGFVMEGGPDSFLTSKPRGIALCEELGIGGSLQATRGDTRRTYVMREGRLCPMPEGLTGLVPSRLQPLLESPILSEQGKERLKQESSIPPRADGADETLAAFMERRFGRELYDRLTEPLMGGIYAGDGEELSILATFPQLRRLEQEFGSVMLGLTPAQPPPSPARPAFVAPVAGMAAIVDAACRQLRDVQFHFGSSAHRIDRVPRGYRVFFQGGETVEVGSVIVCTPAYTSAAILAGVASAAAEALAAIPFSSSATVYLAFPSQGGSPPDIGHGYVVPRVEGRDVLACTWVSQKFDHRAPPGYSLVRVFVGRRNREAVLAGTDDDLVAVARRELAETLGISAVPILTRVFRWHRGMPQYTLGHRERVISIERDLAAHPGLRLAGALEGVGIPDCVASGETAAAAVAEQLYGVVPRHA